MLNRPLLDVALGTLLGNAVFAQALRDQLRLAEKSHVFFQDLDGLRNHCRETLAQALDKAWPRKFRINELQRVAMHLCHDGLFETPTLPVLDQVFSGLMQRHGDYVHYQPRQVQAYAQLVSEIDPALMVAWHLAAWRDGLEAPSPDDVRRVVHAQAPLFVPPPHPGKPVADNHVHLGGIDGVDSALALQLMGRHDVGELGSDAATVLRLRRLLCWMVEGSVERGTRASASRPDGRHFGATSELAVLCADEANPRLQSDFDWRSVADRLDPGSNAGSPWLLYQMAQAWLDARPARAWLWLHLWLWSVYRRPETSVTERVAVVYFMAEAMALRRKQVVEGQGLRRFAEDYYVSRLRSTAVKGQRNEYQEPARRLLSANTDNAEVKITPGNFEPTNVRTFAQAVCAKAGVFTTPAALFSAPRRELNRAEREHIDDMERWHFCLHFVRKDPAGGKSKKAVKFADVGVVRRLRRIELWREARDLGARMEQHAGWSDPLFLGGFNHRGFTFSPSRWARGLDVAGDESAWPIEFFAPQLRWLRRGLTQRHPDALATPGFHFSIHAGEDYAHPLSGMRHTDETVRFCEMRDGDRLGHALALGVPPRAWFDGHGDVLVPVDEHVDNLVWAWHHATQLSPMLPIAGQVVPRLERRIARFLPHVSWYGPLRSLFLGEPGPQALAPRGSAQVPDLNALHRAWLLRRNCPARLARETSSLPLLDDHLRIGVPDHELLLRPRLPEAQEDPALTWFHQRALLETEPAPAPRLVLIRADADALSQRQDGREWGPMPRDDSLLHDHELPEEVEFMEALQDHLLARYACMGLWIETNPSSNVYIARLQNHAEHPIFRWSPPNEAQLAPGEKFNRFGLRRGPMKLLVNTDDPGIMPTTLRMEFELLREAGIDLGYSRGQVEQWLESLRKAGLEQFEHNHQPVFELAEP